jgi:hypothetical protein
MMVFPTGKEALPYCLVAGSIEHFVIIAILYTVLPRRYAVIGSETGDLIRDDVSRNRFSHKRNAKMGRVVSDNLF